MNKLFTKIAALALGAAMAFGVGVAVSSKEAAPVSAATIGTNLVQVTSLTSGNQYVIVGNNNGYALPTNPTVSSGKVAGTAIASVPANGSGYLWTFTKSGNYWLIGDGSKYIYHSNGGNSGTNLAYGTSQASYPWSLTYSTSTQNHWTFAGVNNGTVKTRGMLVNGTNFGGYALSNETSYKFMNIYEVAAAKTLSNITLGGSYTTNFTVGDTFNHTGMTVTAHYSDSSTADKTSSATWSSPNMSTAGQKTVTVSYTEGGTTKTADYTITVSAPTTPTLSLDKASFSGYTGQSFSVTATYANLESDLAWSASGTGSITGGSITWSSSDHRNGTSTYTCTLSGEGGKTIVADADGVDAAQCGITITQTTVNITKASTSIPVGRSETLAASHNASSVGGLNWTSSDNSIATVGIDGKVTVDSNATVGDTVTITARSSVDTSVADTCTVTVAAAPLDTTYDFVTNFSSYNDGWGSSYGEHTGINGKTQVGGDYAATIDLYHASKQGSTITDRPVFASKTGSGSWTKIVGFTLTEPGYKISDVSVTFAQWTTKTPDIALFSGDEASGTPLDSGTIGTKNTISTTGLNDTEFTVGYCDKNTGSNVQGGLTSIYITLVRDNALDHVTVSFASDPADRTFYAGSNFAFNGTLTASYTVDSPKAVTPSGYFLEGEEGSGDPITTSTILTVADHNGGDVYVQYKEGGVTKYDTFTLIVNPAPATSVTLSANVDSVALEEVFEVSSITATVQPSAYATQGVTWDIYDLGGLTSSDYAFHNGEFMASKPADVVFHVKANSNNSVYATFTLTITGDPIAHLLDGELADVTDGSTTVFADAGVLTYGVTTENFEGTITYGWSTSSSATIAINDDQGDTCDFLVKAAGSARLSCRVQGSTKGDVTVYIDVTVSAVTVTSVTWTAPTIDVFSGATITTSDVSSWNVRYSTDSGKTDQTPAVGDVSVKVNGSVVSLPYTWKGSDNGHTLGVSYGGVSSSTTTVTVTQTINAVYAPNTSSDTVSWTASEAADLGSKISSQGGTDEGTISTGDYEWDYTRSLVSLASNKSDYIAFQGETWIQLGSGNALESIEFSTSAITGTIKSVSVVAATAGTHALTIDVGGTKYLEDESLHVYSGTAAADNPDPADCVKTGTGSSSGTITITIAQSGSTKKAMVIRSISVTYETEGSGTTNIANNTSHKAAQRAAVVFAQAFNAAMDETENCTTGLDAAWATCSNAYNSFKTAAVALGSTEEAWAKNLVKYATAQYSDDSGEACLERMMKTYEICVQKHGKTAFMSDLVTLGRVVTPVNAISNSGTEVAIIVVTSMIGLSAVGGYFFLRKRKENI